MDDTPDRLLVCLLRIVEIPDAVLVPDLRERCGQITVDTNLVWAGEAARVWSHEDLSLHDAAEVVAQAVGDGRVARPFAVVRPPGAAKLTGQVDVFALLIEASYRMLAENLRPSVIIHDIGEVEGAECRSTNRVLLVGAKPLPVVAPIDNRTT